MIAYALPFFVNIIALSLEMSEIAYLIVILQAMTILILLFERDYAEHMSRSSEDTRKTADSENTCKTDTTADATADIESLPISPIRKIRDFFITEWSTDSINEGWKNLNYPSHFKSPNELAALLDCFDKNKSWSDVTIGRSKKVNEKKVDIMPKEDKSTSTVRANTSTVAEKFITTDTLDVTNLSTEDMDLILSDKYKIIVAKELLKECQAEVDLQTEWKTNPPTLHPEINVNNRRILQSITHQKEKFSTFHDELAEHASDELQAILARVQIYIDHITQYQREFSSSRWIPIWPVYQKPISIEDGYMSMLYRADVVPISIYTLYWNAQTRAQRNCICNAWASLQYEHPGEWNTEMLSQLEKNTQ